MGFKPFFILQCCKINRKEAPPYLHITGLNSLAKYLKSHFVIT